MLHLLKLGMKVRRLYTYSDAINIFLVLGIARDEDSQSNSSANTSIPDSFNSSMGSGSSNDEYNVDADDWPPYTSAMEATE